MQGCGLRKKSKSSLKNFSTVYECRHRSEDHHKAWPSAVSRSSFPVNIVQITEFRRTTLIYSSLQEFRARPQLWKTVRKISIPRHCERGFSRNISNVSGFWNISDRFRLTRLACFVSKTS